MSLIIEYLRYVILCREASCVSQCTTDIKDVFKEYDKQRRNARLPEGWDIGTFPIAIPRQPPGSRECGAFALEFAFSDIFLLQ